MIAQLVPGYGKPTLWEYLQKNSNKIITKYNLFTEKIQTTALSNKDVASQTQGHTTLTFPAPVASAVQGIPPPSLKDIARENAQASHETRLDAVKLPEYAHLAAVGDFAADPHPLFVAPEETTPSLSHPPVQAVRKEMQPFEPPDIPLPPPRDVEINGIPLDPFRDVDVKKER